MELEDLSQFQQDVLWDIGNGMCGSQTIFNGDMLVNTKQKIHDYKSKTSIPKIINDRLIPVLEQMRKERQWSNEYEFISQGGKIKLIYYSNDDWCKIQCNDNNIIKINKKYFRELYENREVL